MTQVVLSPAEVAAASFCWLARFRLGKAVGGTEAGERMAAKVETFWHKGRCQWCDRTSEELMGLITGTINHPDFAKAEAAFRAMKRETRAARVREAQEAPWYDEVTRG